jgi:citrate lyase subunit beta/citryl-CoA lyase
MQTPLLRSYLFVPGNRPDRFEKALASGADAVIIDLEDAVPAAEKVSARASVLGWLSPRRPVYVRVNAFETEWFRDDVEICRQSGVAGVVLPKAEHAAQIEAIRARLGAGMPILPIVETALGLWNVETLARTPPVERLVFGALDLGVDLQISGDEGLAAFRAQVVLVSRVAGLQPPIDSPTTTFTDGEVVRADASRARHIGFGGKLCIHPAQVAPVREAFAPTQAETAWARQVLAADAASAGAATAIAGEMVDRPVVARAKAILGLNKSSGP